MLCFLGRHLCARGSLAVSSGNIIFKLDIMKKIDRTFTRIQSGIDTLSQWLLWPAVLAMVVTSMVITIYTIDRKFFWWLQWLFVEEWSGYLLIWLTSLALAYTQRTGGHISVEMVHKLLPAKAQQWLKVFNLLVMLVLTASLCFLCSKYFVYLWTSGKRSMGVTETALWIPYLAIPIGFATLVLAVLIDIVSEIRNALSNNNTNKDDTKDVEKAG